MGMRNSFLRLALTSTLLALVTSMGMAGAASATSNYDVRGEWHYSLTCTCGQSAEGTMLLTSMEPTSGTYSGTIILDGFKGTVSGTVTGTGLSLGIILPQTPLGEYRFTMPAGAIESLTKAISGSGYYNSGGSSNPTGTITATRIRSQEQIEERELEEKKRAEEARKKEEEEAQKLKEKEIEERPQIEKAEQEAREAKAKQEAKEREEKEVKAKQEAQETKEREEKEKASSGGQGNSGTPPTQSSPSGPSSQTQPLAAIELITKSPSLGGSGSVSLDLANANSTPISGQLTLTAAGGAGAASRTPRSGKTTVLGEASFTIPAHGTAIVKLKPSKSARGMLLRHRKLRVTVRIVAHASGQAPITKTYSVTLEAPPSHSHH